MHKSAKTNSNTTPGRLLNTPPPPTTMPPPPKGSNSNKFACVENRDVPEYLQPGYDSAHFSPRPSAFKTRPTNSVGPNRQAHFGDTAVPPPICGPPLSLSLRRRLSDIEDATHHVRRSRPSEARTSSHNNHEAPALGATYFDR